MRKTNPGRRALAAKRLFDIVVASLLIIVFSPLMTLLALAVGITSGWPLTVRLERVGKGGNIFKILKFRSMVRHAHERKREVYPGDTPTRKRADDPRLTWFGRHLRRTSLDEIPQLWNVILGDMSLVGPRPRDVDEVRNNSTYHECMISFRPGMTGLAQIRRRRDYNSNQTHALNKIYVTRWRFTLDLWILYKTIFAVLTGRDAY